MPTYEYQCRGCGYRFEEFQRITDEPLSTCPKCGQSVRRIIGGGSGIIFKGSGFYTTDYKRSSSLSGNGSGKKTRAEKAPESKGDSKSSQ